MKAVLLVADVLDRVARRRFDELPGEDGAAHLAGNDNAIGGRKRLAGDADLIGVDAGLHAFAKIEIDDLVRNPVANLVGMAFGNRFAGKMKGLAGHRKNLQLRLVVYSASDPRSAPGFQALACRLAPQERVFLTVVGR